MSKMWECDATANANITLDFTEIWSPTMQLAWQENELGEKELVQLYTNKNGEEKWLPLQTL